MTKADVLMLLCSTCLQKKGQGGHAGCIVTVAVGETDGVGCQEKNKLRAFCSGKRDLTCRPPSLPEADCTSSCSHFDCKRNLTCRPPSPPLDCTLSLPSFCSLRLS